MIHLLEIVLDGLGYSVSGKNGFIDFATSGEVSGAQVLENVYDSFIRDGEKLGHGRQLTTDRNSKHFVTGIFVNS